MPRRFAWLLAAWALGGCQEPAPPDEPPPVTPPVIPWLEAGEPTIADPVIPWADGTDGDPVTRACAARWHVRASEAGEICDPWPEGGRIVCEGASAMRPGETTCTPIGRPCPGGELPDDVPADAIYVRAGAAGTGTRAAPFGTLAEAVAVATAGQTIVIAAGDVEASVTISQPLTLRGACAARTRLTGPLVLHAATTLEDVTVTSAGGAIVARADLTARGVLVTEHLGHGIDLRGGVHTLEDVVVRGGSGSTSAFAGALHVAGGTLVANRLTIEGRSGFGLVLGERSEATITDSVIADGTVFDASPTALVLVLDGARDVRLTRTVIENGVNQLLAVNGGSMTLEDVLIQGARAAPGEPVAFGLAAFAPVLARGVRTHDIDGFGVAAARGRIDVEDYVADGTHMQSVGLHAEEGGTIVARRARLGPIGIGARAIVRGTLELEDAAIVGARTQSLTSSGIEAVASFRRIVAHDGASGLRVSQDGSCDIEDAIFQDIASTGVGDDGIAAYLRSTVTARRIRATRTANACFAALQGAMLEISDARCSGAELGVVAVLEGAISARTIVVEDIAAAALLAEENASLEGSDVVVRRVSPSEAISSGFWAYQGSTARLSRLLMQDVAGYGISCGVQEDPPTVTVEDAIVEDATLGGVTPDCAISLSRVELVRPGVAGITNAEAATIDVHDVRIVDVQPDPVDGRFGHGVHLVGMGTLRGGRLVIEGAHGAGLHAVGPDAVVELTDAWVSGVTSAACGPGCTAGGSGIVASDGARVRITSVRSFGHAVAGVQARTPATVSFESGWIHGNAIGRNVSPDFDVTSLTGSVTYVANGVLEDRSELPLPSSTLF